MYFLSSFTHKYNNNETLACSYVKREVNNLDNSLAEQEAKETIQNSIDAYVHQNIILASETIIKHTIECMNDNEVILTFGG